MKDISDYEFVYALTHEGNIFYVGKCKNVAVRYTSHLCNRTDRELGTYVRSILTAGKFPILHIITFRPSREAESVEETLIKCMTTGGHKLLNSQHSRPPSKNPNNTTRKDICTHIKEEQQMYMDMASGYRGFYQPSIRNVADYE